MEISQLVSFYQIVKTGSFSKPSKNLFITQSAVSHQIKNLEKELKIQLFDRVGSVVKITEAGRIFLNLVSTFLNDLDNLKRISEDINNGKIGHLTIATSSAIIKYVLPDVLKKFMAKYPGIKFKLINRSLTIELLPMLLDGEVDMVIGAKLKRPLNPKLDFLFWKSFDKILLVPEGHNLSMQKTIKIADIVKYPLILFREGSEIRRSVENVFSERGLSYEIVMEVDVAENVERYVEIGIGISIFSSLNLKETGKKRVAYINVNHFFGKMDYGIYHRNDKYITRAMDQFMKFFVAWAC